MESVPEKMQKTDFDLESNVKKVKNSRSAKWKAERLCVCAERFGNEQTEFF